MINPVVKHMLITELDEARYTLSHLVDKTPDESSVEDDLNELILHVRDLQVEDSYYHPETVSYQPDPRD